MTITPMTMVWITMVAMLRMMVVMMRKRRRGSSWSYTFMRVSRRERKVKMERFTPFSTEDGPERTAEQREQKSQSGEKHTHTNTL